MLLRARDHSRGCSRNREYDRGHHRDRDRALCSRVATADEKTNRRDCCSYRRRDCCSVNITLLNLIFNCNHSNHAIHVDVCLVRGIPLSMKTRINSLQ